MNNIEIYVNKIKIDIFSEGINLRLNNVIFDPSKLTTTQAEYSFTFNLPITQTNANVFNYANVAEKRSKFSGRYESEVYANNIKIFQGILKISSIEDNMFKCNLYGNKVNTIETIFGETMMNEIDWKVPFEGMDTINAINADLSTKYFFPMVAYSLFQKVPYMSSESGYRQYSHKYTIDETNRFYYNTFIPSLNLVELLKKCCELKGYTLQGDILADKLLNEIYLSNYIASEQDPTYNLGNPTMGLTSFDFDFNNYNSSTARYNENYIDFLLTYPIPYPSRQVDYENYTSVFAYSLIDNSTLTNITNTSKLLVDGGIQIPSDGWYEITLDATFGVADTQGTMSDVYQCTDMTRSSANGQYERKYETVTIDYSLFNMPTEIQLLRYNTSDSSVESISHDLIFRGEYPNEYEPTMQKRQAVRSEASATSRASNGRPSINRTSTSITYTNITSTTEGEIVTTAVDPYNNPNFICGLASSSYARSIGYLKNGYSWNYADGGTSSALYNCQGYYYLDDGEYVQSNVNSNILTNASTTMTVNERQTSGQCKMIVKLNKNDMLIPFMQQRAYYDEDGNERIYNIYANGSLKIRAVAPPEVGTDKLSYGMESLFDYNLNLGNFLNNEQKISDFINNVIKAFNLNSFQNGNNIIINKNDIFNENTVPINIDNKTNTKYATFQAINMPRSIEVKYKIDTEEEGFYRSVEDNTTEEQMQSNNWKDYGDYGYEKVELTTNDDTTEQSISLNFSYNYIRPFTVKYTDNEDVIDLAVIGKTVWWINGLDYEGSSKYDGRGLTQRMWFRLTPTTVQIPLSSNYDEDVEYYNITSVSNEMVIDGIGYKLNYKNENNSLLRKYFNLNINGQSDEVEIELYLTPMEYKALSNGASIKFNDDIFQVIEISGFDPSSENPTKLKMFKS